MTVAGLLPLAGCTAPIDRLWALERRLGGRVGVAAMNTRTGAEFAKRSDELFAQCATYKWLLAAAVLANVERKRLALDQAIPVTAEDLVEHAPVVSARLGLGALSVSTLCQAMLEVGDNAAANILLRSVGGPQIIARTARSIGDYATRLDRFEPDLNANQSDDPRDTTSPTGMLWTMRQVLTGTVLTPESREILIGWMKQSKTALTGLRAGLPQNWVVGDVAGTGANGASGNIAIAWPPNQPPILIAAYLSDSRQPGDTLDAANAEIGRIVADALT